MSGPEPGIGPLPFLASRIYKSRRTFLIPEILLISIVLYAVLEGFRNGASVGLSLGLAAFGVLLAFLMHRLTRSFDVSIALHQDDLHYRQGRKPWKTISFSDIHAVKFYSVSRRRFMMVTAGPFYQETGFLVGGLRGLDQFKAELKEKLGPKIQETDRWWNKASNLVP